MASAEAAQKGEKTPTDVDAMRITDDAVKKCRLQCASLFCEGEPLLLCSRCKLVKYCSKECQKESYAGHAPICLGMKKIRYDAIAKLDKMAKTPSDFVVDLVWNIRHNLRRVWEFSADVPLPQVAMNMLYQQMSEEEQALLVFEPSKSVAEAAAGILWRPLVQGLLRYEVHCLLCIRNNSELAIETKCSDCNAAFYCSVQHRILHRDAHKTPNPRLEGFSQCEVYKRVLTHEKFLRPYNKGRNMSEIRDKHRDIQYVPAQIAKGGDRPQLDSWSDFFKHNPPAKDLSTEAVDTIVVASLSVPLTLLAAMHRIFRNGIATATEGVLRIHILGASMKGIEGFSSWKTMEEIFHQIDAVAPNGQSIKSIIVDFIGPEMPESDKLAWVKEQPSLCEGCQINGRKLRYRTISTLYHDSLQAPGYAPPDLVAIFNGGLNLFPSWRPTIQLLVGKSFPTVVTAYDSVDARGDATVLAEFRAHSLWKREKNPFSCRKPIPNILGDADGFGFKNSYWQAFCGRETAPSKLKELEQELEGPNFSEDMLELKSLAQSRTIAAMIAKGHWTPEQAETMTRKVTKLAEEGRDSEAGKAKFARDLAEARRRGLSPRQLSRKPSNPVLPRRLGVPRARTRTTLFLLCGVLLFVWYRRDALFEIPEVHTIVSRPERAGGAEGAKGDFFEVDGLLYSRSQEDGMHPIVHLIAQGKKEWAAKKARQSKTLPEAVKEYRRRYKRKPPKGFDHWFEFAKNMEVILVDEYDQINRDLEPFLGLPPELLKKRSREMIEDSKNYYHTGSYTIHVEDGQIVKTTGVLDLIDRTNAQKDIIESFVQWLPDMNITTWMHDTPVIHTAGENKALYTKLARQGATLPREEWNDAHYVADYVGWESFCLPGANLRQHIAGTNAGQRPAGRTFITNHYLAAELCRHPEHLNLHSLYSNYGLGPAAVHHWPLFAHSKMAQFSDILITPLEQYDALPGEDPKWEGKGINRMMWRGSTTGAFYNRGILWRATQRSRLNLLTNYGEGTRDVLLADASGRQYIKSGVNTATLNAQLFDVAFTGQPLQCQQDDGTCDAVKRTYRFDEFLSPEEGNMFKYVMDVDGNGWSGRFHRLLSTRSVVLKSTAYVEWYQDMIQPWVHYVPVNLDYSDLHNIMTFFVGVDGEGGHDKLGKEIGQAGKEWADRFWREEDMTTYMFRLYLEYARVMGPRDGSMDYD